MRCYRLTVLAPAGVDLAVRAIARAQDRTVVTFVHFLLLARVKVVYPDPRVQRRASDESIAEERVERGGGDWVGQLDRHWRVLAV